MPTVTADAHAEAPGQQENAPAAALILCGGLKPPPLEAALGAPLLPLPQTPDRTLLQCWLDAFDQASVPADARVLLTDDEKWLGRAEPVSTITPLHDSGPYRGPAGVLRDAVDHLDPAGCCVIVESSRMLESVNALPDLIQAHGRRRDTVTVATNPDGSFAGLFVADREVINLIPNIGFIDIKEQWLPAAMKAGSRIVSHRLSGLCSSARTSGGYLAALRRRGWFDQPGDSRVIGRDPARMYGTPYGGSLIFRTARVADDAVVSCSAVSDRAEIGPGAVVVRSIVGPGATIAKGEVIVDTVIPAADELSHRSTDRRG